MRCTFDCAAEATEGRAAEALSEQQEHALVCWHRSELQLQCAAHCAACAPLLPVRPLRVAAAVPVPKGVPPEWSQAKWPPKPEDMKAVRLVQARA